MKKIAIGSDHIGFELKNQIVEYIKETGNEASDFGAYSTESADYPVYAEKVANAVISKQCDLGILICGSGVGMSITANKINGIRSVCCSEPYSARQARMHNNANILSFGCRVVGIEVAKMMVLEFINSEYEAGRHQKRLDIIFEIEKKERQAIRLGIDIGGTKINIGLFTEHGSLLCGESFLLPDKRDYLSVLQIITAKLDIMLANSKLPKSNIIFCGVGLPGTIDPTNKKALFCPNLGWEDVAFADFFENITGIRTLLIQDTRAAAAGEYLFGSGTGSKLLVCITLGTGIGSGIIIDGKILNGSLGCAGEIGHIPVETKGRACACGRYDCLEAYSSGKGIASSAAEHPDLCDRAYNGKDVFYLADQGVAAAKEIIGHAACCLGKALVSAVNLLSPDTILFSGGMCHQKKYIESAVDYLYKHSYKLSAGRNLKITTAGLKENAPMIGAAMIDKVI